MLEVLYASKLLAILNLLSKIHSLQNLELKKLNSEKKEALSAQFAVEAALRRVHTAQKDEDFVFIEDIIAPLESEIKMYKKEIAMLQEDKKALERFTKSKEMALVEAENTLRSSMERALLVEDVQNQNAELRRQIEICQEENKILERTNRQKVVEIERLTDTIMELEESILASGAAANAVRDYQRRIFELSEEKKTFERELARVKVSANRVATVVANEWKEENDKVMPVKQWLEERRFMQGEMQRIRDKLALAERTAKAEAQLKERLRLRLKTLEEGLKTKTNEICDSDIENKPTSDTDGQDLVSGYLYDRLQRELINIRKLLGEKDEMLNVKDDEIKVLLRKVDAVTKIMESESRKMRREAASKEKDVVLTKLEENKQKSRNTDTSKRYEQRDSWGSFSLLLDFISLIALSLSNI
ncbi:Microtubule-associated protein 70-5 [Acorus gramineus]|uniref:Microtubule-associated protein 70-5 n=1 Tax=Acorus gramineus TaxID=55184 RepID=A0AAV9B8B5_ACOGR|nr:Microtubule-associated protein 70-5 [Acorus gramineus]